MVGEWTTAKIEDVSEKVAMGPFGSSIKVSTFVPHGIPVISGQHLHGSRLMDTDYNFVSLKHAEKLKNANVYRGDVIFTHAGNIGQVAFIPASSRYERYVISQRQFYLRPNLRKVLPAFIAYYFTSAEGQHKLLANTSSSGVPSIAQPVSYLRTIEIPLPPLSEQRAIAHILGTLDDKIELNRKMNWTLETMARSIFKSWFIDFDPVRAKQAGRNPGFPKSIADLFPDSFAGSELGEIPNGWRSATIGELANINARTLSRKDSFNVIDYIEISEVMHGDVATITRYCRGKEPSRARRQLQHGDTVLSTVRPDRGAFFLCLNPPDTLIASTGFAVITPKDGCWAFLHAALTQSEIGEELGQLADGGAYPAVRPEVIGGMALAVPQDQKIINEFERLVRPLFEKAARNRSVSLSLAAIRDTLLPKLIFGEIHIKDIDKFTEALT